MNLPPFGPDLSLIGHMEKSQSQTGKDANYRYRCLKCGITNEHHVKYLEKVRLLV